MIPAARSVPEETRSSDTIYSLAYISERTERMTLGQIRAIQEVSLKKNELHEITGLLVMDGGIIIQILEGKEEVVRELYSRIKNDDRHTEVKLFSESWREYRRLTEWASIVRSMRFVPPRMTDAMQSLFRVFRNTPFVLELTDERVAFFNKIWLCSERGNRVHFPRFSR